MKTEAVIRTGIAEYCMELDEDNELSDDNIRRCYVDEDYAVYAYNEEYFILYDRQKDEITDFYDPVYAGKRRIWIQMCMCAGIIWLSPIYVVRTRRIIMQC